MACVYVLVRSSSPEDVRYIGISKYDDPSIRFNSHIVRKNNGHNLPVYDWMRKYDDITYLVVKSGISWDKAVQEEINMIAHYRSLNKRLLNMTSGGEGILNMSEESLGKLRKAITGRKHTVEARAKMSAAKKGRPSPTLGVPMSDETKRKLSEAKKGKKLSGEHKKRISEGAKGHKHTQATKEAIGRAHRGKIVSDETRKKISIAHKGRTPVNKGVPMSEAQKVKLSLARKGKVPWNKKIKD